MSLKTMDQVNPTPNVVIMSQLKLRQSNAKDKPIVRQPYDSCFARSGHIFSSTSRIYVGEAGNSFHRNDLIEGRDRDDYAKNLHPRTFMPSSTQPRTFSSPSYVSPQTNPESPPTHQSSKPNIKTRPLLKGSYGCTGTLLQGSEYPFYDEGFDETDKFAFRLSQEGVRYAKGNERSKKFPPMKPPNLITGNQPFEHHSAFLSGGERNDFMKLRPSSAPMGWRPPNMASHRYNYTISDVPCGHPDGYILQEKEREMTQLGIKSGHRRDVGNPEKAFVRHSSPFKGVAFGKSLYPEGGVQLFDMNGLRDVESPN